LSKASIESLNSLHDLQTDYYLNLLKSGEPLKPTELAAINTFLKQNEITVDIVESKPMMSLVDELKDTNVLEMFN
jgi:hypothetical protein